jgi:hypothetical protein
MEERIQEQEDKSNLYTKVTVQAEVTNDLKAVTFTLCMHLNFVFFVLVVKAYCRN